MGKRKVQKKKVRRRTCRVCGLSHLEKEMKLVPTVPEKLDEYKKKFGPIFVQNISKFKTNWICLKDYRGLEEDEEDQMEESLETEWDMATNSSQDGEVHHENQMETGEGGEVLEEQMGTEAMWPDIVEMVPWETKPNIREVKSEPRADIEVIVSEPIAPNGIIVKREVPNELHGFVNPENTDAYVSCRNCLKHCDKREAVEVPETEELKTWIEILGWPFNQQLILNSTPHYICNHDLKSLMSEFIKRSH